MIYVKLIAIPPRNSMSPTEMKLQMLYYISLHVLQTYLKDVTLALFFAGMGTVPEALDVYLIQKLSNISLFL